MSPRGAVGRGGDARAHRAAGRRLVGCGTHAGEEAADPGEERADAGEGRRRRQSVPARRAPAARPASPGRRRRPRRPRSARSGPPTSTSQSLSRLARGSRRSARRASPRPSRPDAAKTTAGSSPAPGTIQTITTRMPRTTIVPTWNSDSTMSRSIQPSARTQPRQASSRPATNWTFQRAPDDGPAASALPASARNATTMATIAHQRPSNQFMRRQAYGTLRPPISAERRGQQHGPRRRPGAAGDHHPDPAEQQADDRQLHQQDGDGHDRRSSARAVMTSRSRPRSNQATPSGGSAWRRPQ